MVMGEKQPLLGSRRSSRRRSRSIGSLPATSTSCAAPPLSSPSTASREGSQANFYLTMLPFLVLQVGLNMSASKNTNALSSSSSYLSSSC